MTNLKINKAIAEHLGWKELDFHLDGKRILGDRPSFKNGKIVSYTVDQYVPDYCNDLNAMHEAEKHVFDFDRFGDELAKVVLGYTGTPEDITLNYWALQRVTHANGRQRAEAFVKTIGKWH